MRADSQPEMGIARGPRDEASARSSCPRRRRVLSAKQSRRADTDAPLVKGPLFEESVHAAVGASLQILPDPRGGGLRTAPSPIQFG